jgi:hypothetical protein
MLILSVWKRAWYQQALQGSDFPGRRQAPYCRPARPPVTTVADAGLLELQPQE